MSTLVLILVTCFAGVAVSSAAPTVVAGDLPKPSWTCLKGVCVGQSRDLVNYRHGLDLERQRYRTLKLQGGSVTAYFYRSTYWTTSLSTTSTRPTALPASRDH